MADKVIGTFGGLATKMIGTKPEGRPANVKRRPFKEYQ